SSSLPPNLSTGRRLVLHVPIFTGLKEYAGIEGSRALIDQRKYELLHDAGRLYLELAQDFYNVLVLERSLKTRTELLSLSRQNVDQLDRFVALGRVKRTEALQARSTVAKLEADVQAVQDNLTRSREALSLSSGVRPDALFADAEPLAAPSLSRLQAEDIAESRADVMAARATLEVSKASLTQAQGEFAPSFYVDGYYNLPRHNVPRNRDIIAQFTFEFPIFSGGSSIAGITKAESEKRTAQLTYDLLKRQALLEIRQAFDAWESSRLQIAAYKKALDAAELNYGAQLDYYNRRLGTIVDLLAALTTLASARDDYQKALLQERLNRVWVGVATGELPVRRKNQETVADKDHSKETAK
ncbi:MAG TPA: TolC family protein, partial [Leptospiraceae bacterium]|nr:TolC family protein [Leptospiraceae bacterium]